MARPVGALVADATPLLGMALLRGNHLRVECFGSDGGMVSTANARLADDHGRVVIVAPMPAGHGEIPGAAEDAAAMSARAAVRLIVPDEQSVAAIGPNPYDPDRRGPAAVAGRTQGAALADTIATMW